MNKRKNNQNEFKILEEVEIFDFNQDLEDENVRSPGWIRYQKRLK